MYLATIQCRHVILWLASAAEIASSKRGEIAVKILRETVDLMHRVPTAWSTGGCAREPNYINARFDEQAAQHPNRVAIRCSHGLYTYEEVAERANNIAAELSRRGLQRGDIVVVCLPHGCDLMIALIGILKAGAGYLAVTPSTTMAEAECMSNRVR